MRLNNRFSFAEKKEINKGGKTIKIYLSLLKKNIFGNIIASEITEIIKKGNFFEDLNLVKYILRKPIILKNKFPNKTGRYTISP